MTGKISLKLTPQRLYSIDAFRGFCMCFILYHQRPNHAQWEGLPFVDLLLPWFIFVVGVSIPLAASKYYGHNGNTRKFYIRLLRRTLILFLLGIVYNGGLCRGLSEVRIFGVLQRIGLCYCFAGIVFFNFRIKGQIFCLLSLLFGYWALLTFVPVPGFGAGDYSPAGNLTTYVDQLLVPGKKPFPEWGLDPEGLLSTIPAIGTCLMGVLCGQLLLLLNQSPQRKVYMLICVGLGAVVLGYIWGLWFPVIKKIWTSSFALLTAGYGCIALATFYQTIEIWHFRKWAFPLLLFGVNPLFIYLADNVVNFSVLAHRFVGLYDVLGLVKMSLEVSVLYWLYRKKIFIRI